MLSDKYVFLMLMEIGGIDKKVNIVILWLLVFVDEVGMILMDISK